MDIAGDFSVVGDFSVASDFSIAGDFSVAGASSIAGVIVFKPPLVVTCTGNFCIEMLFKHYSNCKVHLKTLLLYMITLCNGSFTSLA